MANTVGLMLAAKKIRSLLTPAERKKALLLFGLMIIGMTLEMLGIGLVIPVIVLMLQDDLGASYPMIQPMLEFMGNPGQTQMVVGVMVTLVAVFLIKNSFLAFLVWRQVSFAYGVRVQLSQRLFTTYLRQPYTFHLQRNSAQLIRNVTSEVNMFTIAINSILLICAEFLVLLGIVILLFLVEPLGALLVVVVLGGAAWGFYRVTRTRITRWGKALQYHDGLRIQHLQQGLGGAKDVKLLGRESEFLKQYRVHNVQSGRAVQFQSAMQQFPRLWLELLAVSGLAILVLSMFGQGQDTSRIIPTLALFAAAAFRLIPSVNRVLSAVQSLRYNLPVIDNVHEELKLDLSEAESKLRQDSVHATIFKTDIRLSGIAYTYHGASTAALDGLSLIIKKGEFVGFIGPSGSGKSTLVDVILGLLPPGSGEIRVDGQDIQQNLRAWQDQIGYVPQTIYLTDDTLRRNVAFGLPDDGIDDVAVGRAIKDAQLEEFVASLPEGLQTIVGERGVRLSGGQRQRIGIARALYHDPSVLVLDEATSALDTATEQEVMKAVVALRGNKTILIVAHRLSTVEGCDRLYRLEQGRVVAVSTPAEMFLDAKKIVSES
jgi:ABC-type multidrug transport system fused ATPase/permease subunit